MSPYPPDPATGTGSRAGRIRTGTGWAVAAVAGIVLSQAYRQLTGADRHTAPAGHAGHAHDPSGLATLLPLVVVTVVLVVAVTAYLRARRRHRRAGPVTPPHTSP